MEWLETLKGTIKKTAGIAYDKSTQLVEITKMNFQISEAETSIDKKFKELGIKLYACNLNITDLKIFLKIRCISKKQYFFL